MCGVFTAQHPLQHTVPNYVSALQHTATHCNTLQHTATHCTQLHERRGYDDSWWASCATHSLQHTATHCHALQHTASTATHCNTLQHTAPSYVSAEDMTIRGGPVVQRVVEGEDSHATLTVTRLGGNQVCVCCSVLQCVAVCCSVLQCVAVCCSVL